MRVLSSLSKTIPPGCRYVKHTTANNCENMNRDLYLYFLMMKHAHISK